jgi:hypothetical protein
VIAVTLIFQKKQLHNTLQNAKDNSIKSVLIIGSGPIVVKHEFDYAGSQSARSIREEGIGLS